MNISELSNRYCVMRLTNLALILELSEIFKKIFREVCNNKLRFGYQLEIALSQNLNLNSMNECFIFIDQCRPKLSL